MVDFSNRPERPAPLDLMSEESLEEWRTYMTECALADNPSPLVRNAKAEPSRQARP